MTILDQLAEHAGERVSEAKRKISPKDLKTAFHSSANAKKRHLQRG